MANTTWLAVAVTVALYVQACLSDSIDIKNPVRSAAQDEVKLLPGLSNKIGFKHYSGYLEADTKKPVNRFWHYWFVESQSDPANDPLVLWLNGGPGCSSLLGLLTELGPFRLAANNSIVVNPFAWNKRANVIFMESPAGVGFSYAVDGDVTADDDTTAEQNHLALKSFLRKFPQYSNSPLYLTGESYGGVYLPTLAARVDKDPEMNLKGVAIGNGYLDANKLAESLVYFSYYHGLVGKTTWTGLSKHCCDGKEPARGLCKFTNPRRTAECANYVDKATSAILSSGVNPYNLYDRCYSSDGPNMNLETGTSSVRGREHFERALMMHAFNADKHLKAGTRFKQRRGSSPAHRSVMEFKLASLRGDPPCTNDMITVNYLNRDDVKSALHIPSGLAPFTTCFDGIRYTMIYPNSPDGLAPQMRQLIDSPRQPTLLVYNGDVDLMCNFFGDEWFVDDLNRELVKDYQPWHTNNQVSGFSKHYDRITFVTVKGSGHMVPTDKPAEALHMFEMFLDGMKA